MKSISVIICLLSLAIPEHLTGQNIEDALRLGQPNAALTSRAGGLGLAYFGIADDYAALYTNPAGLTLLPTREISAGFQLHRNGNSVEFLGNQSGLDANSIALSHIGIVAPFKISKERRGSFAIGYALESDFDNNYDLEGFNNSSSIVSNWVDTHPAGLELTDNLAYQTALAEIVDNSLISLVNGNVQQESFVRESGGINSITGGFAVDLVPNLAVGIAMSGKWGGYDYERRYEERDVTLAHEVRDTIGFSSTDLSSLRVDETIDQSFSGVNLTLGFQGRVGDVLRYGLSLTTPTWYEVTDEFSQSADVVFDNGESAFDEIVGRAEYDVIVPPVVQAGLSAHRWGVTVSVGFSYTDLSQLEFNNAPPELEQLNIEIAQRFKEQTTLGVGVEYKPQLLPLIFRAGLTQVGSAYVDETLGPSQTLLSFGAGYFVAPNLRLDLMFRQYDDDRNLANYSGAASVFGLNNTVSQAALQFTYRLGKK